MFFSIVIPTHNSSRTIRQTLESVVQQTFNDFEMVLIDDYSTDNTVEIIQEFLEQKNVAFSVTSLDSNVGVSVARNIGIKHSIGEYIAFLDADDLWAANKLQVEHDVLMKSGYNWVFSNFYVISSDYDLQGKRSRKSGEYSLEDFISNGNPVGMLTVVVKRTLLNAHSFRKIKHEDYDLWLTLAEQGTKGFLIDEYLASYMVASDSLSSNKFQAVWWTYLVFRKHEYSRLKSLNYVVSYLFNVIKRSL
ncbi:glycosyltransferase family 2 protein [Lacticaseibacillus pantheris]|uniref:glycosyltransferase family 2 protein n=1 Tax=Lacticaseibacillus pantheris TaxID=171523 RepID=UPI002658709B|nr:glycosyltransferase family 2 protein [Lacticaseibacillus pantheris]WKF84152.1 glycosyltransferase family 2 protein [Lacticaseibacillus pantheris]